MIEIIQKFIECTMHSIVHYMALQYKFSLQLVRERDANFIEPINRQRTWIVLQGEHATSPRSSLVGPYDSTTSMIGGTDATMEDRNDITVAHTLNDEAHALDFNLAAERTAS